MSLKETAQLEEMKRYLFGELSEKERETLEDHFFEDSNYFYELTDLENDLVDKYVQRKLTGAEFTRFEQSLAKSPERREKIANARAIQTLIGDEKPAPVPIPTLGERISNFFGFKISLFQLATASLAILLAISTGFLLYKNLQINNDLAKLNSSREAEIAEREQALQEKIKQAQAREQDLNRQLEHEKGQAEAINEQLETEQTEKAKLLQQLEILQKEKNKPPTNPAIPTMASIFLLPSSIGRGGNAEVKIILIDAKTSRINFSLQVPNELTASTFNVKLDGAKAAENLKPRATKSGNRVLNIALDVQKLGDSEHTFSIEGSEYLFRLKKQ